MDSAKGSVTVMIQNLKLQKKNNNLIINGYA